MTPREIADWMRKEHAAVEELAQQLRDQVAVVPRGGLKHWAAAIGPQLERFQDHLRRHFELEDEGGYLAAVTDRAPGLARETDRLRHEHDEMDRLLSSIHQELGTVGDLDRIVVEDCCCRVQNLLRYLKDHEEREDVMVISAFTNDLGTKD
jgi:hemerythrin-like domain-containing protein